MYVLYFYTV